jgi:hypothetical protein
MRSFQGKEKVFDYISEKTVCLSKIQKIYFRSWISSFDRAEEAFENCQRTSNMPQINYFKPKTFIKAFRFFDSGIKR